MASRALQGHMQAKLAPSPLPPLLSHLSRTQLPHLCRGVHPYLGWQLRHPCQEGALPLQGHASGRRCESFLVGGIASCAEAATPCCVSRPKATARTFGVQGESPLPAQHQDRGTAHKEAGAAISLTQLAHVVPPCDCQIGGGKLVLAAGGLLPSSAGMEGLIS